ncbi:hypothetical protein CYMTET_49910 [Cymbomonas tetramitiformis]|uniref:Uncharacterized protein n=1 Tax=Cymbomonas tetramitiformis TaxID=36881 RepID=A0AAE0BR78_9CHLO|nr:hypothetical protein CYMTET_49910 [Cymbomonas tetramitiformis]
MKVVCCSHGIDIPSHVARTLGSDPPSLPLQASTYELLWAEDEQRTSTTSDGSNVSILAAGNDFHVSVLPRDCFGNDRPVAGDVFAVKLGLASAASSSPQIHLPTPTFQSGAYTASGNVTQAGAYNVSISFAAKLVSGAPAELVVMPAAVAAAMCEIYHAVAGGTGEASAMVLGMALPIYTQAQATSSHPSNSMFVLSKDRYGNLRDSSSDKFHLQVHDASTGVSPSSTTWLLSTLSTVTSSQGVIYHQVTVLLEEQYTGLVTIDITSPVDDSRPVQGTPMTTILACPNGYLPNSVDGRRQLGCFLCHSEDGLVCHGGQSFSLQEGYWIAPQAASCQGAACIMDRIYLCDQAEACSPAMEGAPNARTVTGFTEISQIRLCAAGYDSSVVLCGRCEIGYDMELDGRCSVCKDNSSGAWVGALGVLAGLVLIIYLILRWAIRRAMLAYNLDSRKAFQEATHLSTDMARLSSDASSMSGLSAVIMDSLQVLGSYVTIYGASLPSGLRDILEWIGIVNFPAFTLISTACLAESVGHGIVGVGGFYYEFMFKALIPFGLFFTTYLIYLIWGARSGSRVMAPATLVLVFLINFVHAGVSTTMFSLFRCRQVFFDEGCGGSCDLSSPQRWLLSDLSVECSYDLDKSAYGAFVAVAALVIVLYVFGFPIALLLMMRFYQQSLCLKCVSRHDSTGDRSSAEEGGDIWSAKVPGRGCPVLAWQEAAYFYASQYETLPAQPERGIPERHYAMMPPPFPEPWMEFLWRYFRNEDRSGSIRVEVVPEMIEVRGDRGAVFTVNRTQLSDPLVSLYFHQLVRPFEPRLYYWPCVMIFRRLMQTSMVVVVQIFAEDMGFVYSLCMSTAIIVAESYMHPFLEDFNDKLSITLLLNQYVILLSCLIVERLEQVDEQKVGYFLTALQCLFLPFVGYFIYHRQKKVIKMAKNLVSTGKARNAILTSAIKKRGRELAARAHSSFRHQ